MPLTIPYSFTNGDVAEAGEVNSNFTNVKTFVDALATGVNIDAAAIITAKIANDAVTADKLADDVATYDQIVLSSQVFG